LPTRRPGVSCAACRPTLWSRCAPTADSPRKLVKTIPHLGGLPKSWFSIARAVESWLQVDKYGLHIDKSQEALETLLVEIDLAEIVPVYMVRFGKNPPNYWRSYDQKQRAALFRLASVALAPSHAETDCVAGHVGSEPANPSARYLIGIP
jgi:hypothetical protein